MSADVLEVTDLTVRFAGVTALDGVSFRVEPRTVHALIGPNGGGKSTCFNVISGVHRPTAGSVRFGGRDLARMRPHHIAGAGVARTFQNIAASRHGTVLENILVGRHHLTRTGVVGAGLGLPRARREERRHRERAREIAAFVGLADREAAPAGTLAYGDAKRLELARAVAMEPRLLLLDEPVAGMNATETEAMAAAVLAVRDALGVSVLLVEHDMGLVMALADHVTVLDFGRRIADGTPAEVQADDAVVRAYLGGVQELARQTGDAT
jgi:branched-chain amino acid transport system ATP-binding protein